MLCQGLVAASWRVKAPGSPDFLLMLIPLEYAEHDKIRLFKKMTSFGFSAWHIVGSPQMVVKWNYAI